MPYIVHDNHRYLLGKYRGSVLDNNDPEKRGKLQIQVKSIWGDGALPHWAEPSFPSTEIFYIPPIGSSIWVEFVEGDPNQPIWTGCFLTENQPHISAKITSPSNRSVQTEKKLEISLNDAAEEIKISLPNINSTIYNPGRNPGTATTNQETKDFIKKHENFVKYGYREILPIVDSSGKITDYQLDPNNTIGYGHTSSSIVVAPYVKTDKVGPNSYRITRPLSIEEYRKIKSDSQALSQLLKEPTTKEYKLKEETKNSNGTVRYLKFEGTTKIYMELPSKNIFEVTSGVTSEVTEAQGDQLFEQDITDKENFVASKITAPVSREQFSALVSIAYNIRNFPQKQVVTFTNQKKYKQAAESILTLTGAAGSKNQGIIARRHSEYTMYNSAPYPPVPLTTGATAIETIGITLKRKDSTITIDTGGGQSITLTKTGDKIVLDSGPTGAVKIGSDSGATHPIVLGDTFQSLFNGHVHPQTGGPNTSTPTSSMGSAHLSTRNKVE